MYGGCDENTTASQLTWCIYFQMLNPPPYFNAQPENHSGDSLKTFVDHSISYSQPNSSLSISILVKGAALANSYAKRTACYCCNAYIVSPIPMYSFEQFFNYFASLMCADIESIYTCVGAK